MDQTPVDAPPPIFEPLKEYGLPEQSVLGEPAFTVGARSTVRTTVFVAAGQGPAGSSVVKVRVTVPLLVLMGVNITLEGVLVGARLLN